MGLPRKRLNITGASPVIIEQSDPIALGREAWARLQNAKAWDDWLLVGRALEIGRKEAMARARTNKPRGRRYNDEFSGWLQTHGFDLDESDRAKLLFLVERLPQVEEYLATLTQAKRASLNHPSAVWRAFRCPDRD